LLVADGERERKRFRWPVTEAAKETAAATDECDYDAAAVVVERLRTVAAF